MVTGTSARILSSLLLLLCLPADVFAFDGDPANAVFVDVHTGSDNNAGTMAQPLHTIGAGISTAATLSRKRVIVAKGDYPQSLTVSSGISLYGGYDQATGWTHSAQNTTTIDGTVSFENAAGEAHFEGFTVLAADTDAGGSSYAVKIVDSAGPVYVQYNTLVSGPGVNGTSGVAGINGISGNNGNGGQNGLVDSNGGGGGGAGGAAGCGGGVGGTGGAGRYGTNNGLAGSNGTSNPNSGGTGGAAGNPGGSGSPGVAGANGTPGQSATFNSQLVGSVAAGAYVAPSISSATAGAASISSGGGGGGGGGQNGFFVQDGTGDGGGGGGGAGCGGSAGSSGQHGGGSFAVFVTNSMATINANRLVIGSGGAGGAGKAGGTGGAGGAGGAGGSAGTGEVGAGGNGGKGGNGGSGGDGAGGNGGPAIGVFGTSAGIVTLGTNRFTRPNPALSGGAPTSNSANAGRVGLVQNAYPDNVDDPAAPTISIADVTIPKSITGTYRAMVRVSLGPIIDATVSVNYQTLDGTAMAGTDYLAASQTLVFDTWSASAFIPITILGHDSPPKTFTIVLTSPSGATLAKATATITIGYDADIIFRDGFD